MGRFGTGWNELGFQNRNSSPVSSTKKERHAVGVSFFFGCLDKGTPGYAGDEKELIARGRVDKKKSPS